MVKAVGKGFTVTGFDILQPVGNVYTMSATPVVTPHTLPVVGPAVAKPPVALQLPPPVASVSVMQSVTQTLLNPPMARGKGLTVIDAVVEQPAPIEYVTTTVPGETPVNIPVKDPIVAKGK